MVVIMFCLFLVFIALCLVHFKIRLSRRGKLVDKIPGPRCYPVVGNALDFITDPATVFERICKVTTTNKNIQRFWFINTPVILLYNPVDVEYLLAGNKYTEKSIVYDIFKPWLFDGILLSKGEKYNFRRKILTPAFHFTTLKFFCAKFSKHSDRLVAKLLADCKNGGTEVAPFVSEAVLDTLCETTLGIQIEDWQAKFDVYRKAVDSYGELSVYILFRPWLHLSFVRRLSKVGKEHEEVVRKLNAFTTDVIRARLQEGSPATDDVDKDGGDDDYGKKRMSILDLLLVAEANGQIDEMGMREEVNTIILGGSDTVTLAIGYLLMHLANSPEAQEKAYKEIVEIFGDSDRHATMNDLNNMRYLECCIKEGLRMYPSLPRLSRYIGEDLQLSDYVLPSGSICHVPIFDVHRHPDFWQSPNSFDPDRFLPENSIGRHPFSYLPFSVGLRNCIGQKYGVLKEKSFVSAILRKFTLMPVTKPDEVRLKTDIVLRPNDPIVVKFVERNTYNQK